MYKLLPTGHGEKINLKLLTKLFKKSKQKYNLKSILEEYKQNKEVNVKLFLGGILIHSLRFCHGHWHII